MAEDDVQLMACPWCGSAEATVLRGDDDEDYDPDDQAIQVIKKFRCNTCGKEFWEPRRYGTITISKMHFDEMGDNENYVWFHGLPEEEYRMFMQFRPDRCLSPSQYRVRKMEQELGGAESVSLDDIFNPSSTPSLDDIFNPTGRSSYSRKAKRKFIIKKRNPPIKIRFPKRTVKG